MARGRGGNNNKAKGPGKKSRKIVTAVGADKVPLGQKGFLTFFDTGANIPEASANLVKLLEQCAKDVRKDLDDSGEPVQQNEKNPSSTEKVEGQGAQQSESESDDDDDDGEEGSNADSKSSVSETSSASSITPRGREDNNPKQGQAKGPPRPNVQRHYRRPNNPRANGPSRDRPDNVPNGPATPKETPSQANQGQDLLSRRTKQAIKRKNYHMMQGPTMNMPKPQLNFKDIAVNDDSPFKPKLPSKPHAVRPLDLSPKVDKAGNTFYEHPYQYEIENWIPPPPFMTCSQITKPMPLDKTPYLYVKTANDMKEMLNDLRQVSEVAFDVEHSDRSYFGLTCLIQISTRHKDYIVDCFANEVRQSLFRLNAIFANPSILKIAHSAQCDVVYLQRDFGIYVVGLFDTSAAEKVVRGDSVSIGLDKLLDKYVDVKTDKKYQLADWRIRPLSREMTEYARMDSHYLIHIYDRQKQELLDRDNRELLFRVYEDSKATCLIRYEKPDWKAWTRKKSKDWNNRQQYALEELNKWRDAVARREDDSAGIIASNKGILSLAQMLPDSETRIIDALKKVRATYSKHLRDDRETLLKIFNAARLLPLVAGVDQTTRIVCRQITLNSPNAIFFVSEFPDVRKVFEDVMAKGTLPNGINQLLPVDTTTTTEPASIVGALKSLLISSAESSAPTYKIITNGGCDIRDIIQTMMSDIKRDVVNRDAAASAATTHIVLFTAQPRCFISIIHNCDNLKGFNLDRLPFEE